jgi:UDP-N-acetylenolpyruvoylglucosamine reductase
MSLIPGNVGTTPVTTSGHGTEIKDTLFPAKLLTTINQELKTFTKKNAIWIPESIFKNEVRPIHNYVSGFQTNKTKPQYQYFLRGYHEQSEKQHYKS